MTASESESLKPSRSSFASAAFWERFVAAGATFVIAAPMIWAAGYSLAYSFGLIGLLSDGFTTRHWSAALFSGSLIDSLLFSIRMAASATLLTVGGVLTLLLVAPTLRFSKAASTIAIILMGAPAAVIALATLQIFRQGGFLSRLAYQCGLMGGAADFPVLTEDRFGVGILIALTCSQFPLAWLYFSQLWNSAKIDAACRQAEFLGATRSQARRRVALPMLLLRGRAIIVLLFLLGLGSFEIPYLLGRQSPQMFSVLIHRRFGQYDLRIRPEAFASATVYFALASLLLLLFVYWKKRHA